MEQADLKPGDVVKRRHRFDAAVALDQCADPARHAMSGLMIFNAHGRLYWGQYGANDDKAWLVIGDAGDTGFVELAGGAGGNHRCSRHLDQ